MVRAAVPPNDGAAVAAMVSAAVPVGRAAAAVPAAIVSAAVPVNDGVAVPVM
jgi:hypothetical protein